MLAPKKAILLDVSYFDEGERSYIKLFVKEFKKNKCVEESANSFVERKWVVDEDFSPYFYIIAKTSSDAEKMVGELKKVHFGEEKFQAKSVSLSEKKFKGMSAVKLEFNSVRHLVEARKIISDMGYQKKEYDILFPSRYLVDKKIEPCGWIEYEETGEKRNEMNCIKKIKKIEGDFSARLCSFDLETWVGEKFVVGAEPIIMTSIVFGNFDMNPEVQAKEANKQKAKDTNENAKNESIKKEIADKKLVKKIADKNVVNSTAVDSDAPERIEEINEALGGPLVEEKSVVYSYDTKKVPGLTLLNSEKELVEKVSSDLKDADIYVTYNGDSFDFKYLKERASKLKTKFLVDGTEVKLSQRGIADEAILQGFQHVDSFRIMKFMQRTGSVSILKLDIENVSEKLFGVPKEKVYPGEMNEAWKSGDVKKLERLVDYNLKDSETALRIAKEFLPMFVEISKLTSQPLRETTRTTTSGIVEDLIFKEASARGMISGNRPKEHEVTQRTANPIKGAFVKEPVAGLHEGIAVLDFASLYPSIIISHNISPDSLCCAHAECKEKNLAEENVWFCTKQKGIFPEILGKMLKQRLVLKKEYKEKKKKGIDDKALFAKQWALKIVLNSAYGYLGYPRARWYSRECASAVTALARNYIQETIKKAEGAGFEVLYGDSVTKDRFVTVLNPSGQIEIKNIEELFEEIKSSSKLISVVGGKEIKSVKGYCALSVDVETKKAEWCKINEIIRHKVNKKIFRVNQKFGETIVTEDHSIIAEENPVLGNKSLLKETKPLDMNGKNFFAVKDINFAKITSIEKINSVKELIEIDLFEILKNYSQKKDYKNSEKKKEWRCDGEYISFGFMEFGRVIKVKRIINVNSKEFEALCRLLGAYIAEGSSSTIETTTTKNGASIASSNKKWLEELQADYNLLFVGAKTAVIPSTKNKRTLTYGTAKKTIEYFDNTQKLQMMNSVSAYFFKGLCGQKSFGKKLPNFIFNVPEKYKLLLLEKMIEGDGSHSVNKKLGYTKEYIEKNFSYTTKSLGVISGLSLLLRQLGRNYSLHYRPSKQVYDIKTSDKNNLRVVTKIVQEQYNDFVYDLSVEKNNNFVDACGQVLLHNTDSNFLKMVGKTKKDVEEFAEKVNKSLPEGMELEVDGFYKRGLFVTKKEGGAAKKRYALLGENGQLKIVGFEYVRRDWCELAKETQRKVIELVLEKGTPDAAGEYVQKILEYINQGKAKKSELAIMTMLQRDPSDYDSKGPHVVAAEKAIARGKELGAGSMLSFIVTKATKKTKSVSDKAELEEYVEEGNYDPEYYIENQVLPAVLKILQELGYSREDLLKTGKQSGLAAWS